jgi:zeaxanthin glucosyltransferase
MAHIGFLSVNAKGHMYPMSSLALHLRRRGHEITFFCVADAEGFFQDLGLNAVVLGRERFPLGYTEEVFAHLGTLKGQAGTLYTVRILGEGVEMQFAELPQKIREHNIDGLMIDQFSMGGATIGDHLQLPYVHVANALMFNMEKRVPPVNFGWGYDTGPLAIARNVIVHALARRMLMPLRSKINQQRIRWNLVPYSDFPNDAFRGHPQISQQPAGFEFLRHELPANFHFVGPLHQGMDRVETSFPWERLDGRPIVYASMGTLQNRLDWIFEVILKACAGQNVQLVLSLGGGPDPGRFGGIGGDAVIVNYCPQIELLHKAAVCVTHAGLNTALESLAQGVPMVAIPITNDQPGVAARIAWSGTGIVIPPKHLNASRLADALVRILTIPSYRENALRLSREINGLKPLERASEILERTLLECRP